jgi:hypothetical protein
MSGTRARVGVDPDPGTRAARASGTRRRRPARLRVLGVVAGMVFAGGAVLGDAVGRDGGDGGGAGRSSAETTHDLHGTGSPDGTEASGDPSPSEHAGHGGGGSGDGAAGGEVAGPSPALVAQGGYRMDSDATVLDGAFGTPFRFRIRNAEGAVVEGYRVRHDRELHLFLVSHDLRTFHHLHPSRDAEGTWTVALPPLPPGQYRAYTDFVVGDGTAMTLATDVLVPGAGLYAGLPPAEPVASVDGYDVELVGAVQAGEPGELTFRVSQGGAPVTHLEPFLGAAGHLVVIRAADLAFLHVHPADAAPSSDASAGDHRSDGGERDGGGGDGRAASGSGDRGAAADEDGGGGDAGDRTSSAAAWAGNEIRFEVTAPTPGDYRIFLDFRHAGAVHTAAFTLRVEPAGDSGNGGAGAAVAAEVPG